MKFCTQVPRTGMHKHLVLDFQLFANKSGLRQVISDSTQNSTNSQKISSKSAII